MPYACHKHVPLELVEHAPPMRILLQERMVTVVLVRHPFDWMAEMRRESYQVKCTDACQLQGCRLDAPADWFAVCDSPAVNMAYGLVENLWTAWATSARQLPTPHIIIRYEDMINAPVRVAQVISEAAGLGTGALLDEETRRRVLGVLPMLGRKASHRHLYGAEALRDHVSLDSLRQRLLGDCPSGPDSGTPGNTRANAVAPKLGPARFALPTNSRMHALCAYYGYNCSPALLDCDPE